MIKPIKFWPRGNSMVIELSGIVDFTGATIADAQLQARLQRRAADGSLEDVPGQEWPLQLAAYPPLGAGVFIGIASKDLQLEGVDQVLLTVTAVSGTEGLGFSEWKPVKERTSG